MTSVRALVVSVLAMALALASAGCTIPTRHSRTESEPVTLTHAFGATVITGTPKRVVALGDRWLDALAALDVAPVGRLESRAGGPSPWLPRAAADAQQLHPAGNMVEQVAALHPDLILLDGLPADRKTYEEFAAVAPTVPADPNPAASWRDQIATVGACLRKREKAERFVADFDARAAAVAASHPGLRGKTYVAAWLANEEQLIVLTQPTDASSESFIRLGLRVPDALTALPADRGHVVLPPRRLGELTADVLLAGYSPGLDDEFRRLPGFDELPAAAHGTAVFLTTSEIAAVEQPTALSSRYLLDKLGRALDAAR